MKILFDMYCMGIKHCKDYVKKIDDELEKMKSNTKIDVGYKKGISDSIKAMETFTESIKKSETKLVEDFTQIFQEASKKNKGEN